jgi:hypothetical protein
MYHSVRTQRPKARSADLTIEDLSDEIVVYDRTSDQVHLLSALTANVWRLCDGKRQTTDIADALEGQEASTNAVDVALAELEAFQLLERPREVDHGAAPGDLSRRSLLTHAAGASAFAAGTILTLKAPLAASLMSTACTPDNTRTCVAACPSVCVCETNGETEIKCRGSADDEFACSGGFCTFDTSGSEFAVSCGCSSNADCDINQCF